MECIFSSLWPRCFHHQTPLLKLNEIDQNWILWFKKLIVGIFSCLAKLLECQLAMQARMILITIQILAGVMVVIKNCILKSFKKRMSVEMNQMKGKSNRNPHLGRITQLL